MLEDFKDEQPLFYSERVKSVKNGRISHAYLLETKNDMENKSFILSFAKFLYCKNHYENNSLCNGCNRCYLIDQGSNSDFLVVEPDGSWIKKEQIQELKEKFKTKSYDGFNRVYVIMGADKLNKQAANSLLKFLEEPENNIIGILVCINRYQVLETLRSRCQLFSLKGVSSELNVENIELLLDIVDILENKKLSSIAYFPVVLQNQYFGKEQWIQIFSSLVIIYGQALRKKYNLLNDSKLEDFYNIILSNNSVNNLMLKIDILNDYINKLEYNLNINLMLDSFVIRFSGGEIDG
ncbi:MAG: hypothetical protein E7168_00365 [Firmicutes bacterium]|nr:hypothetical protein [Bacillota bacterium]